MEEEPVNRKVRKPVRSHPKPPMTSPNSLNQAIRQELWYVDTMVAMPFRTVRRQLESRRNAWAQGADEVLWALEGMARLPLKFIQSAFGESLSAGVKLTPGDAVGQTAGDRETGHR